MIEGTYKYKLFLQNRARRLEKRELNFKKKKKQRNIKKSKGEIFIHRPERVYKGTTSRKKIANLRIPNKFALFENKDEVLSFISILFEYRHDTKIKEIQLDLEHIKQLDSAAICMLLSVINDLSNERIAVIGNYPKDDKCRKMFEESGFLDYMEDNLGHPIRNNHSNLIVETGKDVTKNKSIAVAVQKSMEFLFSKQRRFQPAYTVIMEICSNSVEHAYVRRKKHWRLGVHQNEYGSVTFTMADTGQGILKTLKKKFRRDIEKIFTGKDDCDILYRAFERKYGSNTEEVNRNKGLPCILDKFQEKYIKNLKIITNNVYIDFNKESNSELLNNSFSGVLFSWEVDCECVTNFDEKEKQ